MRKKRPGVWRIFRVGGPRGHTPPGTECTLVKNVCQYNSETSYPKLQVYKGANNIISAVILAILLLYLQIHHGKIPLH